MLEIEKVGEGAGAALTFMLEEFNSANIFVRYLCLSHQGSAAILCLVAERSKQMKQKWIRAKYCLV